MRREWWWWRRVQYLMRQVFLVRLALVANRSRFQFSELLIKVFVKVTFYNGCQWLPQLIAVEVDKKRPDVVDQLINPGKM